MKSHFSDTEMLCHGRSRAIGIAGLEFFRDSDVLLQGLLRAVTPMEDFASHPVAESSTRVMVMVRPLAVRD